jgi:hypothetical protein
MATDPDTQKAIVVPVDLFVAGNPSLAIPVAGLLADKPELVDEHLTPAAWQKALDAYAKTERP